MDKKGNEFKKLTNAYKLSENIYDDVLTQRSFLSKLYISTFWGIEDIEIADKVLSMISDDFYGRLLDIPAGTGVFSQMRSIDNLVKRKYTK